MYHSDLILCLETRQAVLNSIGHWQRMIACAKKLFNTDSLLDYDLDGKEISDMIEEAIGEGTGGKHCALCRRFECSDDEEDEDDASCTYCFRYYVNDGKNTKEWCPLSLIGETCPDCLSVYSYVITANEPRYWLEYARDLLDVLQNFLTVPFTTA
jgi:hypothetical protein